MQCTAPSLCVAGAVGKTDWLTGGQTIVWTRISEHCLHRWETWLGRKTTNCWWPAVDVAGCGVGQELSDSEQCRHRPTDDNSRRPRSPADHLHHAHSTYERAWKLFNVWTPRSYGKISTTFTTNTVVPGLRYHTLSLTAVQYIGAWALGGHDPLDPTGGTAVASKWYWHSGLNILEAHL